MKQKISFLIIVFIFIFSGCENIGIRLISKLAGGGEVVFLFENIPDLTNYTFENIEKEDWEYYRNLITDELKKYPARYFKVTGSNKIAIVKMLRDKSTGIYRGGITIIPDKMIFISIGQVHSANETIFYNRDDEDICGTFHHEQQHIADYSLFGSSFYWKEWEDLYKGSHIGGEYFTLDDLRKEPPAGFITYYSTFAPEEDRAEIAGYWFTRNEKLISKAKEDTALDQKITLLFTLYRNKLSFSDPLREYNQKMGR